MVASIPAIAKVTVDSFIVMNISWNIKCVYTELNL